MADTRAREKGLSFLGLGARMDTVGKLPVDSFQRNYEWKIENFLFCKYVGLVDCAAAPRA